VLAITALEKRYRAKAALLGIDLEVAGDEIVALLGPTGAGKTSTLLCASGLERADAGRIEIDGEDVTALPPSHRDVALVFEGFNLLPTLSAYDNIAFGLRSPAYREDEREIARRVNTVAATLQIAHLLQRGVEALSGGERQRVAIARALVRRPRVYLLDEPLSALDLKLREGLRLELRALHRTRPSTILYATHDYHGAAAIADRIAIIEGGRIHQVGPLDELFADPADATVGALLGSPSMVRLEASVKDGVLLADGLGRPLGRLSDRATPARVIAGLWPDDVEVSAEPRPGYRPAEIYATDFRGMDQAIQVQAGSQAFRRVVGLDRRFRQGDRCWFRLPPERIFLFNATTGARVRSTVRAHPEDGELSG
jgi:multiple sugar transport system ATP-binding protein